MKWVFFISDRTGITTEGLGNALMTQFDGLEFKKELVPFVDTESKAEAAIAKIEARFLQTSEKPIVLTSIINPEVRKLFKNGNSFHLDFFELFIPALEHQFNQKASLVVGRSHGISDEAKYYKRIDAIDYALYNDDGVSAKNYDSADVILVGVSRVGKTPTCLFLAINYGIKAANYPLAETDLKHDKLPKLLVQYHSKLFGLTIDANRLHSIRSQRIPDSEYAKLSTCQDEVAAAERIMQLNGVPILNTSLKSIEEISVGIMQGIRLKRNF